MLKRQLSDSLRSLDSRNIACQLTNLRRALQHAIELEHATIPPYLYTGYSLKPKRNTAIAALLSSVVLEEMSHMATAANLLNAIGGAPVLTGPSFVPRYPGPLPGGVEEHLIVSLVPFSLDVVKDVFMVIEEPESPESRQVAAGHDSTTVGEFYAVILERLEALGDEVFTGAANRQIACQLGRVRVDPVHDLKGARAAIRTIVEQGEGTSTSPKDAEGDLAHYWRFAEIAHGRELVVHDDGTHDFSGRQIPFDPGGVAPALANPTLAGYGPGNARRACATFNASYTALLNGLHKVFNGEPSRLDGAIGLMELLKIEAMNMMLELEMPGGHTAGPSFEYQPVLPA